MKLTEIYACEDEYREDFTKEEAFKDDVAISSKWTKEDIERQKAYMRELAEKGEQIYY